MPPSDPNTAILVEQSRSLGRIEEKIDDHGRRITGLEEAVSTRWALRITFQDIAPWLPGIVALLLALAGRADLAQHLVPK
jgi:hypothetical protein